MKSLKLLICFLLMLALPLQGAAAAAMVFCGSPLTAQQPEHEHHHEHQVHQAETGAAHAIPSHDDQDSALSAAAEHGKCAACAACCTAALVANLPLTAPVATPGAQLLPYGQSRFANHIPEGLDPPPRAFLA